MGPSSLLLPPPFVFPCTVSASSIFQLLGNPVASPSPALCILLASEFYPLYPSNGTGQQALSPCHCLALATTMSPRGCFFMDLCFFHIRPLSAQRPALPFQGQRRRPRPSFCPKLSLGVISFNDHMALVTAQTHLPSRCPD